jgi:hypothetical protein
VSGVEIRPATAGDLPGVLELWRSAGSVPTVSDDLASLERLVGHGATPCSSPSSAGASPGR